MGCNLKTLLIRMYVCTFVQVLLSKFLNVHNQIMWIFIQVTDLGYFCPRKVSLGSLNIKLKIKENKIDFCFNHA